MYAKGGLAAQTAQVGTALMESRDADPDSHTLEFLVEGLGRAGAFDQAIELYEDMVSSSRPPEVGLQAAVAGVYCWAGRVEEGRAQLLEMEEQQMVPPEATFCHLIGAFARAGRGEEVGRAVEEMGRYTMPASHRMVAGIIRGEMESEHSWQRVEFFLDEMKVGPQAGRQEGRKGEEWEADRCRAVVGPGGGHGAQHGALQRSAGGPLGLGAPGEGLSRVGFRAAAWRVPGGGAAVGQRVGARPAPVLARWRLRDDDDVDEGGEAAAGGGHAAPSDRHHCHKV